MSDKTSYKNIKKLILLGKYELVAKEDIIGTPLEDIIGIEYLERRKKKSTFKL